MAIRVAIAKRVYKHLLPVNRSIRHSQFISPSSQQSSTIPNCHHHLLPSPRLNMTELFYLPVAEKLRENLNVSKGDRTKENEPSSSVSSGLSVHDARKVVRCLQLQTVRSAIKMIPKNSISYSEFVNVCMDACDNKDQGVEFAKLLDVAGDVIVMGSVVFLRPDQIAKSMEKIVSQSIAIPNDPRKQELEELEWQKGLIDKQAISQVRCELYCGLGLLILQTLGFMRLTFWELSWDVMEPICFFVSSFHFALAYMFFLRTSKEPSFEGYFRQRFRVKQMKLMRAHRFDYKRYNELCNVIYPNTQGSYL